MIKSGLMAAVSATVFVFAAVPAMAQNNTDTAPLLITVKSDRGGGTHSPIAQAIFDRMALE